MNKAFIETRKRKMAEKFKDKQFQLTSYEVQRIKRKENDQRKRID